MYRDLLEHIYVEYKYCPSLIAEEFLSEEHGYVPNLDKYVSCFREALPKVWKSTTVLSITDEAFSSIPDPFFKGILIYIKVEKANGDEEDWHRGGYIIDNPREYVFDNELKNPRITIECRTSDSVNLKSKLTILFSHELTHMYENFQRKCKKAPSLVDLYDKNYEKYVTYFNETIPSVKRLKQFLYWTDDQEVNANIGALKANLKYYSAEDISNSRKVEQILEKTPFYRDYNIIRRYVTARFIEHTVVFKEKAINNVLAFMQNTYPDKKFNSMLDVEKFCVARWNRCDKKIKDRVGKIFADLYVQESLKGMRVDYPIIDEDKYWA